MRAVIALLLLCAAPAFAQPADTPAERRAAAEALVEASGGQGQVDSILAAMRGGLAENIARATAGRLTGEQVAVIVDEVLMPGFQARSHEITEHSIRVWQDRLSAADMRALAEFYRAPLGRRLLALMPEVIAESARFGQDWAQRVAQDVITRNRDQLRARGIPF